MTEKPTVSFAVRTTQADNDFFEIWASIAEDDSSAADRMADRLAEAGSTLAQWPYIGPTRDDYRPGLRYFSVTPYLLFYRIVSNGVEIVRIVHGARDLAGLFDRDSE